VVLKVCCIASIDEARLAITAGARAVGLVSAMPSGPGCIAEDLIAEIASQLPQQVESWLLTSLVRATDIAAQHARCGTSAIQLVDQLLSREEYLSLRALLPRVALVQVIHVVDDAAINEAGALAPLVDRLLLDSGNPRLAVKELGGTGRTHDWAISARIVQESGIPVFLAGGLNPANVPAALAAVSPHGLDVCSGVRVAGALDPAALVQFAAAAGADA
jgi:phosphoribosylanthranilate isomerase